MLRRAARAAAALVVRPQTLPQQCILSALLQCAQAIAIFGLATLLHDASSTAGDYPLTQDVSDGVWGGNTTRVVFVGGFNTCYAIVGALGCGAGLMAMAAGSANPCPERLGVYVVGLFRRLDQTVAAPLALVAVLLQAGESDVYALHRAFTLAASAALLDIAADLACAVGCNRLYAAAFSMVNSPQEVPAMATLLGRWAWIPFHVGHFSSLAAAWAPVLSSCCDYTERRGPFAASALAITGAFMGLCSLAQTGSYLARTALSASLDNSEHQGSDRASDAAEAAASLFDEEDDEAFYLYNNVFGLEQRPLDEGSPHSVDAVALSWQWWPPSRPRRGAAVAARRAEPPSPTPGQVYSQRLIQVLWYTETVQLVLSLLGRSAVAWLTVGPVIQFIPDD